MKLPTLTMPTTTNPYEENRVETPVIGLVHDFWRKDVRMNREKWNEKMGEGGISLGTRDLGQIWHTQKLPGGYSTIPENPTLMDSKRSSSPKLNTSTTPHSEPAHSSTHSPNLFL